MLRSRVSTWAFPAAALIILLMTGFAVPAPAQDDVTTQNAASGPNGAYITGPASNPLSFLNGPAYRTTGPASSYDFGNFRPVSVLNNHLPAWIAFGAEERLRFESYRNGSFKRDNNDAYVLNRFRYEMDIRPTAWLKVVSQVQDARPFAQNPPIGPPNENAWDLKLAYVQAGDPERQWISVRAGRQLINYNHTIIANSEWRNQGRSYDAVVTNLHFGRVRLGMFAAAPVVPRDFGVSRHQKGNDVFGLYAYLNRILPHSLIEPFVLWRTQRSVAIEAASSNSKRNQREEAYGIRFKGAAAGGVEYSVEGIAERGFDGPNPIRAWAATAGSAYSFSTVPFRPRIFGQYDFASGDRSPADGVHGTFDTMYPTAHDRFGIADQMGWQNIRAARGGVTLEPHNRWTVSAQYLNFSLASARDGMYSTSGSLLFRDSSGRSGTHIGEEFDGYTWYELNRHVNIGGGIGYLLPGSFVARTASRSAYAYPYFAINFKDNGRDRVE
ncbi:MAG TPA: alginate export family protein [Terriglobia bacterium]|nr:alginate export family protein [Terriglobia bacterium]